MKPEETRLSILRVANGWIINGLTLYTSREAQSPEETFVALTPHELAGLLHQWATAQSKS